MYNDRTPPPTAPLCGLMNLKRRSDIFLLGFITLSLLVHLLLFYLLPEHALMPTAPEKKPVYVDLRPPQPLSRELDLPPLPELDKPRETPAKRLGPVDQVVEKEIAPKGEDFDDRTPRSKQPSRLPRPSAAVEPAKSRPKSSPKTKQPSPPSPQAEAEPWRRPGSDGTGASSQPSPPAPERTPLSPEYLKGINLMASAKSAAAGISDRWRRKYRTEVEEGDTVWLDMEKDILISFFQRFRNNVYMVWNYPDLAKERGQEGTCLLKVTITRDGEVKDVVLKEPTDHPLLDNEAIRAIRKGASYGPLPKAYPKDELNIMVFFQYEITRTRPRLY
jgi:periplasmic protein TonB